MFAFENPFVYLLQFFAELLGGNFGYAIIVITLIIRFLLLPLFIKQEKDQKKMQEKINNLKPELKEVQEKLSNAKNQEEQLKYQLELINLRKKHNINLQSMGFLPALLQAPVFMGFYGALTKHDMLQNHHFLWFELSSTDVALSIIVGLFYFLLFKINSNQSGPMVYLFPLIMTVIALTLPSGIGLYWAAGTVFMIVYRLFKTGKKRS